VAWRIGARKSAWRYAGSGRTPALGHLVKKPAGSPAGIGTD